MSSDFGTIPVDTNNIGHYMRLMKHEAFTFIVGAL